MDPDGDTCSVTSTCPWSPPTKREQGATTGFKASSAVSSGSDGDPWRTNSSAPERITSGGGGGKRTGMGGMTTLTAGPGSNCNTATPSSSHTATVP